MLEQMTLKYSLKLEEIFYQILKHFLPLEIIYIKIAMMPPKNIVKTHLLL